MLNPILVLPQSATRRINVCVESDLTEFASDCLGHDNQHLIAKIFDDDGADSDVDPIMAPANEVIEF